MRIAIVTSNTVKIDQNTKKGSEIFVFALINNLVTDQKAENISLTAFCSGDSSLPIQIESVNTLATSLNKSVPGEKRIIFELALISKAFSMQDKFDLFHMNIGNGDIILPFARFVKKPILITLHYTLEEDYMKSYFALFKDTPNVFFVSISNAQRTLLPQLNYIETIYHGVDTRNDFTFNNTGGDKIMWAGRAIPEKGMDIALEVARRTERKIQLFAIRKDGYDHWVKEQISGHLDSPAHHKEADIKYDYVRHQLIPSYQSSKLFLFPILWEEPFGLVMIEAMSCGTPVVAYARGSVPEIIKDGETGFIVNPSDDDMRGDWIIKKTGIEGLCEAVERIYEMPKKQYEEMRGACRLRIEKFFTVEKMADAYKEAYKKIAEKKSE